MKKKEQSAQEWVDQQIKENKEHYQTPVKMIDEQIRLLEYIKTNDMPDEKKWELITAVGEAYHVVLWVNEEKRAQRLVNTIMAFVL